MKFHNHNGENEVETLIAIMAKLPGLGPRSARRAVIRMLEKKEIILEPLAKILNSVTEKIKNCNQCGNFSIDSVSAEVLFTSPFCISTKFFFDFSPSSFSRISIKFIKETSPEFPTFKIL